MEVMRTMCTCSSSKILMNGQIKVAFLLTKPETKSIWNLFKKIQKTITNSQALGSALKTHTGIGQYSVTVKKSKRFHFLTDLE